MRIYFTIVGLGVLHCVSALNLAAEKVEPPEHSVVPQSYTSDFRDQLREPLARSGEHVKALLKVADKLKHSANGQQAYTFLVANMPDKDLKEIPAELVIENVKYGLKARERAPWSGNIPEEIFLNDVLPYASLDEVRENWRKDFYERFSKRAWECNTPGEAARWLNKTIYKELNVRYDQKRSVVNASPSQSIKEGMATCTGLSILLINACRACGIPARMAGIPAWKTPNTDAAGNHGGNHNWVEVWDAGGWHCLGASEDSELDKTWFLAKAKDAVDGSQWQHAVYASSWKKTSIHFPLVWNIEDQSISAVNVSERYVPKK